MFEEFGTKKEIVKKYTHDDLNNIALKQGKEFAVYSDFTAFEQFLFEIFKDDIIKEYNEIPTRISIKDSGNLGGKNIIQWMVKGYINGG